MIENERQYQFTRAAIDRFELALLELLQQPSGQARTHPLLHKAQEDAIRSEIAVLETMMLEYIRRQERVVSPVPSHAQDV